MLRKEQSASVLKLRHDEAYLSFLFSSTLPTCLLFIFSLALIASAVAAVSAVEAAIAEAEAEAVRLLSVFKLRDKIARGCKKRLTTRRAAASSDRHSPRDASLDILYDILLPRSLGLHARPRFELVRRAQSLSSLSLSFVSSNCFQLEEKVLATRKSEKVQPTKPAQHKAESNNIISIFYLGATEIFFSYTEANSEKIFKIAPHKLNVC